MSEKEYMAADVRGPLNSFVRSPSGAVETPSGGWGGKGYSPSGYGVVDPKYITASGARFSNAVGRQICVLSVSSGVPQQIDLMASGHFGDDKYLSRFVRIKSETAGAFHYAWFQASGGVIDRTATLPGSGTGACVYVDQAERVDEVPSGRYFVVQPASTGIIRIWVTNQV